MDDSYPDDLFPFSLWIIPVFILAIYSVIVNGITSDTIIIITVTVMLAIWNMFILLFIVPKLKERNKIRKRHKKELIDGILKSLQFTIIKHKNFEVSIENLKILKKLKEFEWTFQHLKHKNYSYILTSWQKLNKLIEELNDKLADLKLYIDNIITEESKDLSHYIWDIIQLAFYKDTKVDYIKIEKIEDDMIVIPRNEKNGIKIPYVLGEDKTKAIISKILKQDFRKHMKGIQEINDKLREEFKDRFQKSLEKLRDNINNRGYELKGKCKGCVSFWKL